MPNHEVRRGLLLVLLLCAFSGGAAADEDWLIARVNGQWTWEKTGAEGRVQKNFLNQEVLRLGEDGQVTAVSALPLKPGEAVTCSETARRNPKTACSSVFLECRPTGGGAFSVMLGFILDGGKGASEARNSYSCALQEDAVLEAAHAVGLIENIAAKKPAKGPEPVANPAPPVTD